MFFIKKSNQRAYRLFLQWQLKMIHIKNNIYLVSQNPKYFKRQLKECFSSIGYGLLGLISLPFSILLNILSLLWLPFQMLPRLYDFSLEDDLIVKAKFKQPEK